MIHYTATNMLINGGEKLGCYMRPIKKTIVLNTICNNSVYQSHVQLEGQKL